MKTIVLFMLFSALGFNVECSTPEKGVYYYYNQEDTHYGSNIIVFANTQEEAYELISQELYVYGLTFESTNIIAFRLVDASSEGFVIYSNPGEE